MNLVPVTSSNVQAIGYDPASRMLLVQFKGGATYSHQDVSPQDHAALLGAKSIGSHYHQHFKDRLGVKKVEAFHDI